MKSTLAMGALRLWAVLASGLAGLCGVAAHATEPRLPIAEGVWVGTEYTCGAAPIVTVYSGNRIGDYHTYGPNGSLGPVGQVEPIISAIPVRGGWTRYNFLGTTDGTQVMPLPNGHAAFRMFGTLGPARNPGPVVQVWRTTMRRCPLEQLSPRMRAVIAPLFATAAPAPAPSSRAIAPSIPMPAAVAGGWSVRVTSNGTAHALSTRAAGAGVVISLACVSGQPWAFVQIPGRATRYAVLDAVTSEGTGGVTLDYVAQSQLYGGSVEHGPLVALLGGNAMTADLQVEGRPAGRLSLAGAGAAIRYALASCWQPPAPVAAAPAAAPVGPLAIAPGYYVDESVGCGEAFDAFFYDGARVGRADLGGDGALRVRPLGRVTGQSNGTLLLVAFDIELRRLANDRIELTIQDTGPPMRLCDAGQLPPQLRVDPHR